MSTRYYAKNKEPKIVYDQYKIGKVFGGEFIKVSKFSGNDDEMYFNSIDDLKEFINTTKNYTFIDEYDREISKEDMIKIVEKEK